MSHHPNIELIEQVVDALGALTGQLVFLGGSTTILLLTDPAAPPARASMDVDAIVRIGDLADYHRLGRALRDKGFVEDATLVVLAEDLETDLILTTDQRDFSVYRFDGRKPFRIVP